MPERDRSLVEHILHDCDQVETAHGDFGRSEDAFRSSTTYQNAVSMCILQIGELVNHLSDEFKSAHSEMPWRQIRGMRNYVAHQYGSIDLDVVWHAATVNMESLRAFCKSCLE